MEFSGLIGKYQVNRELTDLERTQQLKQKQRLDLEPHYQLSVIKMNSTYLESVDKWFSWKGLISGVSLIVIVMIASMLIGLIYIALNREEPRVSPMPDFIVVSALAVLASPLLFISQWMLRKESFAYTHYPMRFNRKTRQVHVFRTDGTVLTTPWDSLFFTLGCPPLRDFWEVRAHVLAADCKTVIETFPLSYFGTMTPLDMKPQYVVQGVPRYRADDYIRGHWEFIRRYMEEGPETVTRSIQFCMPIDRNRESFRNGLGRVFANFAGAPLLLFLLMVPFNFVVGLFRYFAMQTSRIPVWPKEIEDACSVEPDDPYAIHGAPNGDRVPTFPEAAARLGVRFEKVARPQASSPPPKPPNRRIKKKKR